jgi:hypothetical protein
MINVVLIISDSEDVNSEQFNWLKLEGFHPLQTMNPDEVDQVGLQAGKCVMIFMDPQVAVQFLTKNKWSGFAHLNLLLTAKSLPQNEKNQKVLNSLQLLPFQYSQKNEIIKTVKDFLNEQKKDEFNVEELQFNVNFEANKK